MIYKLLQINTIINSGSVGHIAEDLGKMVMSNGWESYIAYGRNPRESSSKRIRIGNDLYVFTHVLFTRLFDLQGVCSYFSTKKFIKKLESINPSIIHLHNIHGYYLNYPLLFKWIAKKKIPVVWTLHDCWPFTGHCAYYTFPKCEKWKNKCIHCKNARKYPACFFIKNTKRNFNLKKYYFTLPENINFVVPSIWLKKEIEQSFLSKYPCKVIYNGINVERFKPAENLHVSKKIILGVASVWEDRKGLKDFVLLADMLKNDEEIYLVGVSPSQAKALPSKIKCIQRTETIEQLALYYSSALVFLNLTYEDNFPTTNLEALACGTPVITYRTGGSPEALNEETGFVVEPGDLLAVLNAIEEIEIKGKSYYSDSCRKRVLTYFNKEKNYEQYLQLYKTMNNKI